MTVIVNWEQVEKLLQIQCTRDEIASVMNMDSKTLVKHIKDEKDLTFEEYKNLHSGLGKANLRKQQMAAAEKGNTGMLIWLGKQYLGQAEKSEIAISDQKSDGLIELEEYGKTWTDEHGQD